jgi:hypothetical protein
MKKDPPPPHFDWVSSRHACSAELVFQDLCRLARENVETRNRQLAGSVGFSEAGGIFKVWSTLPQGNGPITAEFSLKAKAIQIVSPRGHLEVVAILDDDGVCRCRIDKETLDLWQVLRRALEPVLFPI